MTLACSPPGGVTTGSGVSFLSLVSSIRGEYLCDRTAMENLIQDSASPLKDAESMTQRWWVLRA